jgi:cytochrome P450
MTFSEQLPSSPALSLSSPPLLLSLLIILFSILIIYFYQTTKSIQTGLIQRPPSLPFLGHALHFLPTTMIDKLHQFKSLYGPVYELSLFNQQFLIIHSSNLIKEITIKRPKLFRRDHQANRAAIDIHLDQGSLFFTEGHTWSRLRRLLSTPFNKTNSDIMNSLIKIEILDLIKYLHETSRTIINTNSIMMQYTLQVILRVAMGTSCLNNPYVKNGNFANDTNLIFDYFMERIFYSDFLWKIMKPFSNYEKAMKANLRIEKLVSIVLEGTKTNSGTYSDTIPGNDSGTKSGTHSDTISGNDSDTKSGNDSDTKSGTHSDTIPGNDSGKSGTHSDTISGNDSDTKSGNHSDSKIDLNRETKMEDKKKNTKKIQKSFLDILMIESSSTTTTTNQNGETKLSQDEVLANIKTMILAGSETTSVVLSWCFFFLSQSPNHLERLRKEAETLPSLEDENQNTIFDDHPITRLELPFAAACFKEAMRLRSPAPFIAAGLSSSSSPFSSHLLTLIHSFHLSLSLSSRLLSLSLCLSLSSLSLFSLFSSSLFLILFEQN